MSNSLEVLDPISKIKFIDPKNGGDLVGSSVVNADVFDLTRITDITDKQVTFSVSFLVNLREIKRQIDAAGLSVDSIQVDMLADPGNGRLNKVSSTDSIGVGLLMTKENLKKITEVNGNVFHAVRLSVVCERSKIENTLSQKIRFAFFVSNNQNQRGQENQPRIRSSMTFRKTFSYSQEKKDFYSITVPVKIGASVISRAQTIITVEKTKGCKASGVIIYRRRLPRVLSSQTRPEPFQRLADVTFSSGGNASENSTSEILVDSAFPDPNPLVVSNGRLDNSYSYVYRAVPTSNAGGKALSFSEFTTTAINDGDVIIGERTSVLPVFLPKGEAFSAGEKVTSTFTDDQVPSYGENISDVAGGISITSKAAAGAILLYVANLGRIESISIVRRNVSLGEKNFTHLPGSATNNLIPSDDPEAVLICTDEHVVDGQTYEYKVVAINKIGVTARAQSSTTSTYRDFNLLPGAQSSLEFDQLIDEDENVPSDQFRFNLTLKLPDNVFTVFQKLSNERGQGSIYLGDIQNFSEKLQKSVSFNVIRYDVSTGQKTVFSERTSRENFFREKSDDQSEIRLVFNDTEVPEGNKIKYEAIALIRDPFSIQSEVKSVDTKSGNYAFQPAKGLHPLFLTRGIIPPTRRRETFIRNNDIAAGPARLLNRLTPEDPFEIGISRVRASFPSSESEFMSIDTSLEGARAGASTYMRPGTARFTWVSVDDLEISHFRVDARDTYFTRASNNGSPLQRTRRFHIFTIPNTDEQGYVVESRVEPLSPGDELSFSNTDGLDILGINEKVKNGVMGVQRQFIVTPVLLNETEGAQILSSLIQVFSPMSDQNVVLGQTIAS
jgi:hypothetical protein